MRWTVLAAALAVQGLGASAPAADAPGSPKSGESKSVKALLEEMGGELPGRRLEAAKALARKGPDVVPVLIRALKSKDWKLRRSATDALAELKAGARPALSALVAALKDKDAWVRHGAVTALGSMGLAAPGRTPATTGPSPGAKGAAGAIARAVRDEDIWVREAAMHALARQNVTADKKVILSAAVAALRFPDSGWTVRRHAIDALWRHGKDHKPAVPALVHVLKHPSEGMWDCTKRVVELLIGLGAADQAVGPLMKLMNDKSRHVPGRAIQLLGLIGPAAAPALDALAAVAKNDKDEKKRAAASQAIELIRKKPKKNEQKK